MKKNFSILALMFFLFVSGVLAQDKILREKPDFSGNWELDKKESSRVAKSLDFYTIKISQTGEEIQINKNFKSGDHLVNYTLVLFTDKRGEKNVVPFGEQPTEIKSETYWHKNQIYFDFSYLQNNAAYRRNMYYQRNIEKYKLSEDGNTLTIVYDRRSSTQVSGDSIPNINIPISTKLVFRKADG